MTEKPAELRVASTHPAASVDGVRYHWVGNQSSVLVSFERGLELHELRMIGNVIFKVAKVEKAGLLKTPEVSWIPATEFDVAWIRRFKAAFFKVSG